MDRRQGPGHKSKRAKTRLSNRPTPEDIRKIRQSAAEWGKVVARRAFGPQGPGPDISLTAMEELALEVSRGLVEGTLHTLLEQQAQALGIEHPCPDCQRLCPIQREPRTLHLKGGHPLQPDEPSCHCPDCRRDFFPPSGRPSALMATATARP